MNSKHAFLALSVFTLVSIAHGEREVFAPTKLAPTATAGTVLFGNGTQAAPAISFSADSDTGIYKNGADVAFSVNDSNKFYVSADAGAVVAIGNQAGSSSSPVSGTLRATSGGGTNIAGGNLTIQGGNSTGSAAGGYLAFQTAPAGASGSTANALTERMRITADGLTQINRAIELGNTITDYPVSTAPQIYSTGNGTGIFADYGNLVLQPRSSGALRNIIFANGNPATERVRINSAGNVFVGNGETAASVANGNIRATGGSGTNINGADLVLHGGQSTGTAIGGALRFFTAPASGVSGTSVNASTERMRIDSSGDVFVGNGQTNASPIEGPLRATGGSGSNIAGANMLIAGGQGTGTGAGGVIRFSTAAAGSSGSSPNSLTERFRIKQGGQVRFVPLAAAPTLNVEAGDVYYDTGTNKLRVWNGTAWQDLH